MIDCLVNFFFTFYSIYDAKFIHFIINFSVFGTSAPSVDIENEGGEAEGDDHEQLLMVPINIEAAFEESVSSENTIKLPIHHRCAAHTLNLIARDAESKQENEKLHQSVASKLKKLWNKQSRSSLISGNSIFLSYVFYVMISQI